MHRLRSFKPTQPCRPPSPRSDANSLGGAACVIALGQVRAMDGLELGLNSNERQNVLGAPVSAALSEGFIGGALGHNTEANVPSRRERSGCCEFGRLGKSDSRRTERGTAQRLKRAVNTLHACRSYSVGRSVKLQSSRVRD